MKKAFGYIIILILVSTIATGAKGQSIAIGPVNGHITVCQGEESQNQNIEFFSVNGGGLTNSVTATASAGFEISLSEYTAYAATLTLTPSNGQLSATIYVRMTPSPVTGIIPGTVTLSSPGLTTQTAILSGVVLPLPTANPLKNITVLNGASVPAIYFSGTGNAYTWVNDTPGLGTAASGTADSIPPFTAINNSDVPVTATITVTPLFSEMLYVTNDSSNTVSVVNTDLNVLDTTISTAGRGPMSECLSPDGTRLYVVNTISNSVSVFNTGTLQRLTTISVGNSPQCVAVSPDNSKVYVSDYGSNSVLMIDAASDQVTGNIPVPHVFPRDLTLSGDGSELFVISGNSNVDILSTITFKAITSLNLPSPPFNIALNPVTDQVFVTSGVIRNFVPTNIAVIDAQTNNIISSIVATANQDGLAFSPDGTRLYTNLFYHVLGIFDTGTYSPLKTFSVPWLATGAAISADGTRLYLSRFDDNQVSVINTATYGSIASIPVGHAPLISINSVKPGGCSGQPVTFTITVNPAPIPVITITGATLAGLNTTYGTPSASESFSFSGTAIRSSILITPPKGFEVSLDDNNFSPTVSIGETGSVAPVTVYIRLAAATPVGSYSGGIAITSPAVKATVTIGESVDALAPLTIKADNKSKVFETPNPPLTVTYTGFVNGDVPGDLLAYPVISTDAVLNSPPGNYPINLDGAGSQNYTITYIQGVLSVIYGTSNSSQVTIPNAFTPNGDGINDTWDIQNIGNYPDCSVQVFNRYGQMVFSSIGYGVPWDGSYKGSPLPVGAYYYIVNLNAGTPILSGSVAIIR